MMNDITEVGLVETEWLAENLNTPGLVILDASWHLPNSDRNAYQEYLDEHIEGSLFFNIDEITDTTTNLPHMLPTPVAFSATMRKMGIGDSACIVVYDTHGIMSAPRVWWTFLAMGINNVAVLNGGLKKWKNEGRPLVSGPPPENKRKHFTARPIPELCVNKTDVLESLDNDRVQIIDARPEARFNGDAPEPREGLISGHMPSACNLPFSELVNEDGTFKSEAEIRDAFEKSGIDLTKRTLTTCGSGITASVLALGLYVIGNKNFAVYDGSWGRMGQETRGRVKRTASANRKKLSAPIRVQKMRSTAAAVLIGNCGRYLLQRRDDIPNILFPGMIGLFGGHIEKEESADEAVRREIAEETGYDTSPKNYMSLMTCVVPLPDGSMLDETLFLLKGVPTDQLVITEGTLLPIAPQQLDSHLHEMTPATAAAIQAIRHCLPA